MIVRRLLSNRSFLNGLYSSKRLIAQKNESMSASESDSLKSSESTQNDSKITSELILNKLNASAPRSKANSESLSNKAITTKKAIDADEEFDGFTKMNPAPVQREQQGSLFHMRSNDGSSFNSLSSEKKRKIIEYNWVMNRENGHDLPEEIDQQSMELLMETQSYSHLQQTFEYLVKKQFYKKEKLLKRQEYERRLEENKKKCLENPEGYRTSYPGHSSFVRYSNQSEKQYNRNKLLSAYLNQNPSVVFDFHFEHLFDSRDELVKSLYRQMVEVLSQNVKAKESMNIHFCNFNYERKFHKKYNEFLAFDENLIFETPKSYLDVFPKEQLVYLTRDSKRVMRAFDPNKVYIIGAIVDTKTDAGRLASYAQAKKDGIATESLPLDHFVEWQSGSKTLNINTVFEILLNLYNGRDWASALEEAVPRRKIIKKGYAPGPKKLYKN